MRACVCVCVCVCVRVCVCVCCVFCEVCARRKKTTASVEDLFFRSVASIQTSLLQKLQPFRSCRPDKLNIHSDLELEDSKANVGS